ncbi:rRNA maturation RNase YbeY [Halothiobacillus sp. DCM-1]|uniref:rRNA maturation RNase YbeY n=1 Tax=Halothiobacillus sp. DCM-1 TaxID=3112558 RepID=UPI0032529A7B
MSCQVWVDRQKATVLRCPTADRLTPWVAAAVAAALPDRAPAVVGVCARFVDAAEGQALNQQYRHKNYATNVLSFPFDTPLPDESDQERYLGDLVLCQPVLVEEARAQGKSLTAHTAHLIVHGVLHLLGFDHETPAQAEEMEGLEIQVLAQLGFENPYRER